MKKVVLFLLVTLLLSSCAITGDLFTPFSELIEREGGDVEMGMIFKSYEVMVDGDIVKKQDDCYTAAYLYEKNDDYYWRFYRGSVETRKTFFPEIIDFKIDKYYKYDDDMKRKYVGKDVDTGVEYTLLTLPWERRDGKFFILSNKGKAIVYSISIFKITTY